MAEETYSKKLTDPRWQKKRLKILERDEWKCIKCGDKKTELHVHHLAYYKNPWDIPNKLLKTLCAHCHYEIEKLKRKDAISADEFDEIKVHKSNNWTEGSRIMFVRYYDIISMAIYDNDKYIIAFDIEEIVFLEIKKLMVKSKI